MLLTLQINPVFSFIISPETSASSEKPKVMIFAFVTFLKSSKYLSSQGSTARASVSKELTIFV